MIHLKINISGKVQGVWFRVKTKDKADELKLSGFVQNENNGSVYLEVSGQKEKVYLLVQWLQIGSELSSVDKVCIQSNKINHDKGFSINR